MQLDAFFMELIQVSLLDGLALGLGSAFVITSLCGLILTRRTAMNITWGIAVIASLIIGVISGFLFMLSIGLLAAWTGSAVHGLSGADLTSWTEFISSTFSSYQSQAIVLSYIGSLAGLGMGYGIGIRPKEEATTFGTAYAILGVCGLAFGFTLTMLPTILTLSTSLLYTIVGLLSLLFVLFAFRIQRGGVTEEIDYEKIADTLSV